VFEIKNDLNIIWLFDNQSARLEADANNFFAETVFLTSGNYVSEIIDIEADQAAYPMSSVFSDDHRFNDDFGPPFEKLSIQSKLILSA
jgi:hypothetical protein